MVTYVRMLDADAEGADWREVARIVRNIDPESEAHRARRAFEIHLARAKWMVQTGYRHLLHAADWRSEVSQSCQGLKGNEGAPGGDPLRSTQLWVRPDACRRRRCRWVRRRWCRSFRRCSH